MNPRTNPYAPGAGTIPPELAGRSHLLEGASIQLDRCRNGLASRGLFLVGLRGVGKTVLLTQMSLEAENNQFVTLFIETPENRSLPALIIPGLRTALLKLDKKKAAGKLVKHALNLFGGFVSAMKLKYHDVEFQVDMEKESGADTGDLEYDLSALFISVGQAAKEKNTAIVLLIDEIQYIVKDQFSSLIMALHKCAQRELPVILIGAGLPQLIAQAGAAKSYAERLFEYHEIGPLDKKATTDAIQTPAIKAGVKFNDDALDEIFKQTQGYPYFLQEWGKHCWQVANQSPITLNDVKNATELALSELDAGFFRVRFDRMTPSEKKYLRAMAELGQGPHRSGDIAELLKKEVQSVAPTRAKLISKGMIYSQSHGDASFTVPLFDGFMKRVIPEL